MYLNITVETPAVGNGISHKGNTDLIAYICRKPAFRFLFFYFKDVLRKNIRNDWI